MKNLLLLISTASIISLLVGSCRYDNLYDLTQHTNASNCDPDSVYYVNDVMPIIVSNCTSAPECHKQDEEDMKNLTSYDEILNSGYVEPFDANNSKLIEVLTEDGDDRMPLPPREPLTSDQIQLLTTWINQGAANNECSGGGCDTSNVTYSGTIANTMETYCNGCHGGVSPSAGIDLTSYSGVAAIAEDGSLLGSIQHESGYVAMPYGGSWLPDCKIEEILIWVQNGYTND